MLGLAGPGGLARQYRYNPAGWPVSAEASAFTELISYCESPGFDGARYYDGRVARLDNSRPSGLACTWLLGYHPDGRLRVAQCGQEPGYSIGTDTPISYSTTVTATCSPPMTAAPAGCSSTSRAPTGCTRSARAPASTTTTRPGG